MLTAGRQKTDAVNDSDSSYALYETLRKHENFQSCPRGTYVWDVVDGKKENGKTVPETETLEYMKRMKKEQKKNEKKKKKDKKRMNADTVDETVSVV